MDNLKFICVQPDDVYYTWQVHLWLESLREIGHSDKAIVLIFTPHYRKQSDRWQQIIDLYPEAEFEFFMGTENLTRMLGIYIPVLRPYCLSQYFKSHPELINSPIFYCDSDVLFTKNFDLSEYLNDDVNYLSDTNSYINASYFDSKIKDVLPEKQELYKNRDVLAEVASLIGITRETAQLNNLNSGGAQYLLKNIDSDFWTKVMNDCIVIRTYLQTINKEFFESENKGFQSWCADMWAVLWNLWFKNRETKVIKELDFAWASDPIEKLENVSIFHNAGIVSEFNGDVPNFYKGKYHRGTDPTKDEHIYDVIVHPEAKKKCTWFYTKKLIELKNKYQLNY